MMSARLLRHKPESERGRFYRWSERMFEALIARYSRTLRWVLWHQTSTLLVAGRDSGACCVSFTLSYRKDCSRRRMSGLSKAFRKLLSRSRSRPCRSGNRSFAKVILQDPAVASLSSFIWRRCGRMQRLIAGRIQINLRPFAERRIDAAAVINRLETKLRRVEGIRLYLQPVQDLTGR